MLVAKPFLAFLLIMSMLAACAGPSRHDHYVANNPSVGGPPESYADKVDTYHGDEHDPETTASEGGGYRGHDGRYAQDYRAHYHEEPHPQDQAVAEAALIVTASAFVCTFVVVVLDGACNFGVGFGYHYY